MLQNEQALINKVKDDLPIKVFPTGKVLPKLREAFPNVKINTKTELEIHSMVNMGVEGGIVCEIRKEGVDVSEMKTAFLSSITHFKIKRGEPHFSELEKYRTTRNRSLMRQNRPRGRFF